MSDIFPVIFSTLLSSLSPLEMLNLDFFVWDPVTVRAFDFGFGAPCNNTEGEVTAGTIGDGATTCMLFSVVFGYTPYAGGMCDNCCSAFAFIIDCCDTFKTVGCCTIPFAPGIWTTIPPEGFLRLNKITDEPMLSLCIKILNQGRIVCTAITANCKFF